MTAICHALTGLSFCTAPALGAMGSEFCVAIFGAVWVCLGGCFARGGFFASGAFLVSGGLAGGCFSSGLGKGATSPWGSFGRSGNGAVSTCGAGAAREGIRGTSGGTAEGGTIGGCGKGAIAAGGVGTGPTTGAVSCSRMAFGGGGGPSTFIS
jgi:hypothetical protein